MRIWKNLPILALLCLLASGCNQTVSSLRKAMKAHPIPTLELEQGFNTYVSRSFLKEEKIECGRIIFQDDDYADYWFKSHHISDDSGYTLFVFTDGKETVMEGWFCCEVQLPRKQLMNKHELIAFVKEHDGNRP